MKRIISKYISNTIESPFNTFTYGIFQKGIYLFLFLYFIHLLPIANIIFGSNSIIPKIESQNFLTYFFNIFQLELFSKYYWVILIVYLLILLKGILYRQRNIIEPILVYYFTINFFNKSFLLNTGAQQIVSLLLFYMIFINNRNNKLSYFENLISNLGLIACKFQIMILYFFSAYYKYFGELWLDGSAVFYALKIEDYNPFWITSILSENNILLITANYMTLSYLTLFPLILLLKNRFLLLAGVIMHLSIAFIMGINDFGLIMATTYLIFIPERYAKKIIYFFKRKKS